MAWEYEGLFDAMPATDDSLLAEYWKSEATATRIGSMGYRTRTIKAGTRLEAEVYPIFGRSQEAEARKEKLNLTRERQQQLNTKRAKRRLVLLMETNFRTDEDVVFLADCLSGEETLDKYGIVFLVDPGAYLDTLRTVREMKARLFELGFMEEESNGRSFGSKTKTAVEAFQKAAGLDVTGVADEATQEALYSDTAPHA